MEPLSIAETQFILDGINPINPRITVPPELINQLVNKKLLREDGDLFRKAGYILHRIWSQIGPLFADKIVLSLGAGTRGAAYLLDDGTVLKLTNDSTEAECIKHIIRSNIENPHFPIITDSGMLNTSTEWFYYIREPLDDIQGLSYWIEKEEYDAFAWDEHLAPIASELKQKYHIDVMYDHGPENWGIRPNGDPRILVLRDVSCIVD